MFDSADVADAAFKAAGLGAASGELVRALVPAIGFAPSAASETSLGATRIGGTPDLPQGTEWPIRPVPGDVAAVAARGGSNHGDHIRKHLGKPLPFQFLAQVDLTEMAAVGPVASDLPSEGRLLFFYDVLVGPWDNGKRLVRVIWDKAPRETLRRLETPPILTELAEAYVADVAREMAKWREEKNLPAPADDQHTAPYWGPSRGMRLQALLQLPDRMTVEADGDAALKALMDDDNVADALGSIRDAQRRNGVPNHILLGTPVPEQDDPRYDAVVVTQHGVQHLERSVWTREWPRIREAARDWRLLLQIDLKDFWQDDLSEGRVYFLIRVADLAARNFADVVAVYQQT